LLIENGMQIFESTAMVKLEDHTAYTHSGSVTADKIIVAVDKPTPSISALADEAFHAQTFLSVTEPLNDRELRILFPCGALPRTTPRALHTRVRGNSVGDLLRQFCGAQCARRGR
jgi:gamma-glutamylputrescine oxidase